MSSNDTETAPLEVLCISISRRALASGWLLCTIAGGERPLADHRHVQIGGQERFYSTTELLDKNDLTQARDLAAFSIITIRLSK